MTPKFDEGQPNWGHFVRSSNPKSVQSFRGLALKTSEITSTLSFLSTVGRPAGRPAGRPYHRTHMNTYTHRLLRKRPNLSVSLEEKNLSEVHVPFSHKNQILTQTQQYLFNNKCVFKKKGQMSQFVCFIEDKKTQQNRE